VDALPYDQVFSVSFAAYFSAWISRPAIPVKTFPERINHIELVHIVKYYRV